LPNGIPQGYNVFFDILQEIQDEGIALPFQPTLNFIGTGVTATDDPGNSRINVDIPGVSALVHDLLDGTQNQDTVANPATAGDLIIGNASPLWDVLSIGTPGQVLTQVAGFPAWATPSASNPHDLLDGNINQDTVANMATQGSLIKGDGTPLWGEFLIGSALQQLRVNVGGTDLEYFTPSTSMVSVKSGTATVSRNGSQIVTFGAVFSDIPNVVVSFSANADYTVAEKGTALSVFNITTSSFTVRYDEPNDSGVNPANFQWIATDAGNP